MIATPAPTESAGAACLVRSLSPTACLAATELVRDPNFQQLSGDRPVLWGINTCNTRATVSVKTGRRHAMDLSAQ